PGLRRIKRLLVQKAIGRPLSVRAHWGNYLPDWHPWENYQKSFSARADLGGGVLLTLSHPLDYLRWLLGEIDSVRAYLGYDSDLELNGVEDTAEIGLRFTNGVIGSTHLNYNQRPPSHLLEIVGTEGTIQWGGLAGSVKHYSAKTKTWEEFPLRTDFERNDLYISEMKHFVAVALGQFMPICSLEDGIAVQKIVQGAKQSAPRGHALRAQQSSTQAR
ncbi:MAG: Gfo/Idh/MocA family oxidoreductase, partial [Chloroflexota bacterium]|nr:Gfo/Idh/MocA family oxidoreductase [Chloroflexota bacterium]